MVKGLKAKTSNCSTTGCETAQQRLVRAEPRQRRDSHGRQRQHGDQDGAGARNRRSARRRPDAGSDEVAFYSFDTSLKKCARSRPILAHGAWEAHEGLWRDVPVGCDCRNRAENLAPATSASARGHHRRRRFRKPMKPADVSAIASSLDVPVYILVITFALDTADEPEPCAARLPISPHGPAAIRWPCATLRRWCRPRRRCSANFIINMSSRSSRHEAWMASLIVRARNPGLFVRARSGYLVK